MNWQSLKAAEYAEPTRLRQIRPALADRRSVWSAGIPRFRRRLRRFDKDQPPVLLPLGALILLRLSSYEAVVRVELMRSA